MRRGNGKTSRKEPGRAKNRSPSPVPSNPADPEPAQDFIDPELAHSSTDPVPAHESYSLASLFLHPDEGSISWPSYTHTSCPAISVDTSQGQTAWLDASWDSGFCDSYGDDFDLDAEDPPFSIGYPNPTSSPVGQLSHNEQGGARTRSTSRIDAAQGRDVDMNDEPIKEATDIAHTEEFEQREAMLETSEAA